MHDEEYAQKNFGCTPEYCPLVLPYVQNERRRITYTITEYDPLLDSSNMSFDEWAHIAENIKVFLITLIKIKHLSLIKFSYIQKSYQFYDGFVILHGTDTLSYTASALSFMFENLGKTVILTGSQIPIFETRTDGKNNFTSALIIAGNYVIPGLYIIINN